MVVIKKKIKFLIFFLVFIIIAPIVVLYANGDILGNGWSILSTGGIYVNSAPTGSEVYFNGKLKSQTSFFERNILIKNLKAGNYEISVKKDGYNSWTEKVKVSDNLVSDANVFILQTKVDLTQILPYILAEKTNGISTTTEKINQDYNDISLLFSTSSPVILKTIATTTKISQNKIGTKNFPILNGNIGLWNEKNQIFVKWFGDNDEAPIYLCNESDCTKSLLVENLSAVPKRIDFLPGFNGVVLVALGNKIFAVQMEENPEKTEQIIYEGSNPDFRVFEGYVYIKDKNLLYEAKL